MGSLTSRPSVPRYQQPVAVRMPVPQPAIPAPAPAVPAASAETQISVSETTAAPAASASGQSDVSQDSAGTSSVALGDQETRDKNLLNRSRGRLSTIRTGFKGILSQSAVKTSSKTLLGE